MSRTFLAAALLRNFCPARPPLGGCGHVSGFRARPASRGRVGSLAVRGLGPVLGGRRSRDSSLLPLGRLLAPSLRASSRSASRGRVGPLAVRGPGPDLGGLRSRVSSLLPLSRARSRSRLRASSLAGLRASSRGTTVPRSPRRVAGRASSRLRAGSGPAEIRLRPRLSRYACATSSATRSYRGFATTSAGCSPHLAKI